MKESPTIDLWDRYQRLQPWRKSVLRFISLISPAAEKQALIQGLIAARVKGPNGKLWSQGAFGDEIGELRRQGLLTATFSLTLQLMHRVAVDAVASDEAAELLDGAARAFPLRRTESYFRHNPPLDPYGVQRHLRMSIYTGDAKRFAEVAELVPQVSQSNRPIDLVRNQFSDTALDRDWVASRPAIIQAALIDARMSGFLNGHDVGADLPELVALARSRLNEPEFAPLRIWMLIYETISGRLDAIRAALAAMPEDPPGGLREAAEGTIAFLSGQNSVAVGQFRASLKLLRKFRGRRKGVFLETPFDVLYMLALLQTADVTLHAEIQTGLDTALGDPSRQDQGMLAAQAILWLLQGQHQKAQGLLGNLRARMPTSALGGAMVGLAEFLVDPDLARAVRSDHAARFLQTRDHLPLVARIHAEILREIERKPTVYQTWLDGDQSQIAVSFTRLVTVRPAWEYALQTLDAFLGGTGGERSAETKTRRLAWFVDPESTEVEVAEQVAKGRDGWSDGRSVALKRLHERDPKIDYLTDADIVALRGITVQRDWSGSHIFDLDPTRVIPALIGHKAVFDARQRWQPIELIAYPVELVVTEQKEGFRIALSHSSAIEDVFLEPETPTRYRVVEFTAKLLTAQEILSPKGIVVPASARDQVVNLVRRNNPSLPVRDEAGMSDEAAICGEPTPVVQCLPLELGMKLHLVVRPFGAAGPAYVAGLGGRSVRASIAGQSIRANRDLDREQAGRTALIEACPTLRDRAGDDAHEVVIDDLEGCLEVLTELQAYTGGLTIEWPEGQKMTVSKVLPGKMKLRVGQDRNWFAVEGSVALDDDQVLEMKYLLERLDRAHGRFVRLDDGRFIALTRQLQAQLQGLAAVSEPHKNGRRVHALGAGALAAVLDDAGEVKADAAWKRHVASIRAAEGWTPQVPATLQAELRDYQVEGFVWLSRLARWGAGACLADDMGLGKTVQAIAVILDRAAEGPCLVVAPTSVCPNWEAELGRFAPTLTVYRLAAAPDRTARIAGMGPHEVLISSYGLLHQESESLSGREWQMVVLDEAQAIKNAESRRAQASVSLQARLRLALSGTPVENDLDELWSLFNFVNPGLLGSREGFQKRFAGPIERDRNPAARQALRALIRPFLLRRTKAAVLSELPPRTEQTVQVEMSDAERAFYEALRQKALENIAALSGPKGKRKLHILTEIMKLRRACCNPALIDAAAGVTSGKLAAFLSLVDELLRNRHRALVFSQFVGHLALVREALDARGVKYEYLDGSTSSAERERRVAAFQSGSAELFLISLRAGGTGLNLTAADYVVHLDPWWNPAVEDQASDRAHRIGQERPVTIYRLIMQDSIEQRILELHRDKRDLASDLLEGTETTARLSEEELLDLLRP
jgi:superfamily II DNA or RNA helicase